MEIEENIAGLGKNHDKNSHQNDIAKKQSEANPAAENLDMMPNSRNANGGKEFLPNKVTSNEKGEIANIRNDAANYTKEEHEKADNWENTETGNDKPTF